MNLSQATTAELGEELKKRQNVKTHIVEPEISYHLWGDGPATILVVRE